MTVKCTEVKEECYFNGQIFTKGDKVDLDLDANEPALIHFVHDPVTTPAADTDTKKK